MMWLQNSKMIRECTEVFCPFPKRKGRWLLEPMQKAKRKREMGNKGVGGVGLRSFPALCTLVSRAQSVTAHLCRPASLLHMWRGRPTAVSRAQGTTPWAHWALRGSVALTQAESDTATGLTRWKHDTAGPLRSPTPRRSRACGVTGLVRAKRDTACRALSRHARSRALGLRDRPRFRATTKRERWLRPPHCLPKSAISPRGALALPKSDTAAVSLSLCAISPAQLRFRYVIPRFRHVIALSSSEPRYRSSKQRYRRYICAQPSQSGIFLQK